MYYVYYSDFLSLCHQGKRYYMNFSKLKVKRAFISESYLYRHSTVVCCSIHSILVHILIFRNITKIIFVKL